MNGDAINKIKEVNLILAVVARASDGIGVNAYYLMIYMTYCFIITAAHCGDGMFLLCSGVWTGVSITLLHGSGRSFSPFHS